MANRRTRTGALPTWEQQAAVGYLAGGMAYKQAQKWAAAGVDPDIAAMKAQELVTAKLFYWVYVVPWTLIAGALFWMPYYLGLWKFGLVWMAWEMFRRIRQREYYHPAYPIWYRFKTRDLILVWVGWNLLGAVLMLAAIAGWQG